MIHEHFSVKTQASINTSRAGLTALHLSFDY